MEWFKRWLKCRALKQSGKREDFLKRVGDCVQSGNQQNLDPSMDDGKWFAAKVIWQNSVQ